MTTGFDFFGGLLDFSRRFWKWLVGACAVVGLPVAVWLGFDSWLAGIVTGLVMGFIYLVSIGYYLLQYLKRVQPNNQNFYKAASEQYAFQKNRYSVRSTLRVDGSAVALVDQRIHNIRRKTLEMIEYNYFTGDQQNPNARSSISNVTWSDDNRRVFYAERKSSSRSIRGAFIIDPPLAPRESLDLSFQRESDTGTFLMNVPEEKRDYIEYSGVFITYPMDQLTLQVIFPDEAHFPQTSGFHVYYGSNKSLPHSCEEMRLHDEGTRIVPGAGTNPPLCLTFHVKYPLLGLNYVLWWHPRVS